MVSSLMCFVLLLATIAVALPLPPGQQQDKDRRVLSISRAGLDISRTGSDLSRSSSDLVDQDISSYTSKPYQFGFELEDGFGMSQYRSEASDGTGVVKGSYGYMDPMGVYRKVEYTADNNGYRAVIRSNEPGTANQNVADALFIVEPPPPGVMQQDVRNDISPRNNKA